MSRTLSLSTNAFDSELFSPVKLMGSEHVNQIFSYSVIVKTPDKDNLSMASKNACANADLTSWLGQNIRIAIELDGKSVQFSEVVDTIRRNWNEHVGKGTRYICGIITQADFLYDQGRSSYYSVVVEPKLSETTLRSNYRVFQDQTVIEVLRSLIEPYALTVDWRLSEQDKAHRYPKRDFVLQYGETDYQFFERLCSEFGINYWHEHNQDSHVLILSDAEQGHKPISSEAYHKVSYYPPKHKTTEEYLHEFNLSAKRVSGAYASSDYDYTRPKTDLLSQVKNTQPYPEASQKKKSGNQENPPEIAKSVHEIYQYAADVSQPEAGPAFESNEPILEQQLRSQWNLERLQQHHFEATAKGNIRGLATGHRFTLEHHSSSLANRSWVIRSTKLTVMDLAEESQRQTESQTIGEQNGNSSALNQILGALNNNQQWLVECELELIPSNVVIRASFIPKPEGRLQTALVVGEEKNSIQTDKYGRIKVQFHWDRYGTKNENSSCWVRVNEPWAGNQMGAVFTPRIGQEVLIDFINNDPDLPVCIGKVNNGDNLPPWALTANQALSGFRSRELGESQAGNSASGRSNHLIFDDSEAHIQTQLKSDHAHSSVSLGDIYRVETNKGRMEGRGQGFELRTDDWGAARAAKGMYLSTFAREKADSTSMDAFEAQSLLKEARELVKKLSKLANTHHAEQLSAEEPLNEMVDATASDLPKHPQAGVGGSTESSDATSSMPTELADMGMIGDGVSQLSNLMDESSIYASVLPMNLPKAVKAQATESILQKLSEKELLAPIAPINPLSDPETAQANDVADQLVHYNNEMVLYEAQQKTYEQNLPGQAKAKLDQINQLEGLEKQDALLNDSGIKDIFSQLKTDNKEHEQLQQEVEGYSPEGFTKPLMVVAADAGLALVSPKTIQAYSSEQHSITTGGDFNLSTGKSWRAIISEKLSFLVFQGVKIFSAKEKIELQAQDSDIDLIAKKVVNLISTEDWIKLNAKKGILLNSGGSYLKITPDGIEHGTTGDWKVHSASKDLVGPKSMAQSFQEMPQTSFNDEYVLKDQITDKILANYNVEVTRADGSIMNIISDKEGKIQLMKSEFPEKVKILVKGKAV